MTQLVSRHAPSLLDVVEAGRDGVLERWVARFLQRTGRLREDLSPEIQRAGAVLTRMGAALRQQPSAKGQGDVDVSLPGLALMTLRDAVFEAADSAGASLSARDVMAVNRVIDEALVANQAPPDVPLEQDQRSRQQLHALLEQLPVAVVIVEAPSGLVLLTNRQSRLLFGSRATPGALHETLYDGWTEGSPPAESPKPLARSLGTGELVQGELIKVRRDDGTFAYLRANSGPIRDGSGNMVAAIGIYDDVTAERQHEDALRFLADATALLASSLDYETTLRNLAGLAVPHLADWCAVEMAKADGSSEQLALAHLDPKKLEFAEELRRRYPPDPAVDTGVPRILRTGEAELYEYIPEAMILAAAKDEDHLRILRELGLRSALAVPIRAGGHVLGVLSLVSDEGGRHYSKTDLTITQEIADRAGQAIENAALYRDAQSAIRTREDFLSVASHELRTPLMALNLQVSTFIARSEAGQTPDISLEKMKRLYAQVLRMTTLVNQLLDVSQLATGTLALSCTNLDLGALAKDVIERFSDTAADARSALSLSVTGSTTGFWDRGRLEQVVTNLISNALKYAAGTPIAVRVEDDGGAARLSVADQGPGIALVDQERIFERFERAAPVRSFGGLGLGLWIVKQIVSSHGGSISVESAPGEGSRFIVQLPKQRKTREADGHGQRDALRPRGR